MAATNRTTSNILLIQVDQLAASALHMYGNQVCQTPNLDRLAAQGVIFKNAYCNYPLCAPSRFSMASGLLASKIGAYDNGAEFPASIPTYAHYLRANGYHTILSGKMHFVGPDQLHGFEERLTSDIYPADFQWAANWRETLHQDVTDTRMFDIAGACVNSVQIEYDEHVTYEAKRKLYQLAQASAERPFFMQVSFTHPHDPYLCKQSYWNQYKDDNIPLPHVPAQAIKQPDPHSYALLKQSGLLERQVSDAEIVRVRRAYYGAISFIDEQIGQLLQVLQETGMSENTVILFTSDHGEMLGERGMWLKKNFFEPALKIPLLVHAPHIWQSRQIEELVSLVDLLPTLLAIASETNKNHIVDAIDGENLVPIIDNYKSESSRTLYAELTCEGTPAPIFMVRRGKYKYIHCDSHPPLLYDLNQDVLELENLAADRAYSEVLQQLQQEVHDTWDSQAIAEAVRLSQSRRRIINDACRAGVIESWDYKPKYDASPWFRGVTNYNEWAYAPLFDLRINEDS